MTARNIPFEAFGWLASACVLCAFLMRRMRPLRLAAIASNLSFLVYAAGLELMPVLLLHAVLLPVNLWRLRDGDAERRSLAMPRHTPHPLVARMPAACLLASLSLLLTSSSLRCAPASDGPSLVVAGEVRVLTVGAVVGALTLPTAGRPVGLVLLLPDSLGHDPRSAPYIDQLLRVGLAAFDVQRGGEDAAAVAAALPALQRAATVENGQVGVIGFGTGARVALQVGAPVRARVLLYPGCEGVPAPARTTATLLLHGETDPANPHEHCAALAARLGSAERVRHFSYRGAGYAWDYPAYGRDQRIRLPRPNGQGTAVTEPWPELTAMSASQSAEFLARMMIGGTR